jgi:transglutaminase-like putative cysteine protease
MVALTVTGEPRRRTIEESRIVALLMLHGWTFEVRSDERTRAEREAASALEGLVAQGLPWAQGPDGERLFDHVEVSNFMRRAGLRGEDPVLLEHYAPSARHMVRSAEMTRAAGYAVTIRRRFNLADRTPGAPIRLRLPTPLLPARTEFLAPQNAAVEARFEADRVEVALEVPVDRQIDLGIRTTFDAVSPPPADPSRRLDQVEADLYLRGREGLIQVDGRAMSLAERLTGDACQPLDVIRRLWGFMMDELAFGVLHHDRINPADPYALALSEGWYDCRLGSAMLAAMCRARGIPARVVHGYMLYSVAPDIHTWMEAWIDGAGWRPFDLLAWDLEARSAGGAWREHFFGRIDHRLPVERPPRLFAGTGDVRLPRAWQMLTYADEAGTVIEFQDLETGALVYAESIAVERLEPPP